MGAQARLDRLVSGDAIADVDAMDKAQLVKALEDAIGAGDPDRCSLITQARDHLVRAQAAGGRVEGSHHSGPRRP